jgi:hypothetical protein
VRVAQWGGGVDYPKYGNPGSAKVCLRVSGTAEGTAGSGRCGGTVQNTCAHCPFGHKNEPGLDDFGISHGDFGEPGSPDLTWIGPY